ncbi:DGQHR domain-containing protein [Sphingobium xenophagum]|uniref:DGQHR domain-containing protein n=1 Tax=Sphingobium xenophagum TaxID=121428 RepID=A0ABU1WZ71_SPHXE|nr:DGQHR domain-containing protein [Sphingobium xenophagum]MDR7154603.1 DGQHR domain-containing protein [Sphingobium xenophagum]
MAGGKVKPKKKQRKLTPEERKRRRHQRSQIDRVRGIFGRTGFVRVPDISDKEFTFSGRTGDVDDVFVRENIIVCTEYTISTGEKLGDHIKGKVHLFQRMHEEPQKCIAFLFEKFPTLRSVVSNKYHDSHLRLRILYCSNDEVNSQHKALTSETIFLWGATVEYFRVLTSTLRLSARHEMLQFLRLDHGEIGVNGALPDGQEEKKFEGSLLPVAHSNFPTGYKVVSFYVTPGTLLDRAYVLRKDGWRQSDGLYQRLIDKKKIDQIRLHLKREKRVFANNVIVTLPEGTRLDKDGKEVNPEKIDRTTSVMVKIPNRSNSIGIVDGQHRIFSYFEDAKDDPDISEFRARQNLLATGVIYPEGTSDADRERFEAGLFLEINANQNSAKTSLKQAIKVITEPYSDDSIGKRLVTRLGKITPLEGLIERHAFEKGVLPTSSMVSFALAQLIRIGGDESLLNHWSSPKKADVLAKSDNLALIEYVEFCATQLSIFLSAAKACLPASSWAIKKNEGAGVLATVSVNGLIILFRKVVKSEGLSDFEGYKEKLKELGNFDFHGYHSSHYNRMANDMLDKVYGK